MTIEIERKPAVHDQVLVEAEIDGAVVRFRAVIVNLMPSALWVGLVNPDTRLVRIRPGDPIQLTFRRGSSAMVADSSFLSHLGTTQSRLFSLEWPDDCRLVQRRAHLRLDAQCPVRYTVVSQSDAGGAGRTGEGQTRNVSAGGVQFRVKAPISEAVTASDAIELQLILGQETVLAEAEVVRVEDGTDLSPDGRPLPPSTLPRQPATLIAVRFVSISSGAQDRIVRHIFSLQRMRKQGGRKTRPRSRRRD